MNHQNNFELVEDYLTGRLKGDALKSFERELKTNKALQKEVSVQRDLLKVMKDAPDHAFFQNLSNLRKKHTPKPKPSKNRFWLYAILGILIVAAGYFFMSNEKPADENIPPQREVNMPPENNSTPSASDEITETNVDSEPEKEADIPKPPEKTQTPEKPRIQNKPVPKTSPPPVAQNFRPNPQIEKKIPNLLRGDYDFKIESPTENATLSKAGKQSVFHVSGTLETSKIPEDDFSLLLELYSNNDEDYKNGKPIFESFLDLTPNETHYLFDLKKELDLTEGLYYYLLKDDYSGAVFCGGKIRVMSDDSGESGIHDK